VIVNVIMGGLAGLVCAIGGAIKDSPHEGFRLRTFWRSPCVGLAAGAVTALWTRSPFIAFLCAGYLERAAVEGWKIVRCQKPGKHSWKYNEWPWLWAGEKPIEEVDHSRSARGES
jgi:uncharacterized membrane protein